ncbi:hypothetical protein [Dictyobacter arantiisoli]|uniref:Uncharacterized protein n=1 Tax=Dictyobacter arantiisoli TaxID=2014874 RepID=A0A5A5T9M2_9CHLR|nr:hypothetical protein [Dictyobacter arantiisoli]GCF07604.1 hypothetical protein KDI_11680 [Dictyobacter arantiisoli]
MSMDHNFWLFQEGERSYTENHDLWGRQDAPVNIDDEMLRYFLDTLLWIPTFNPEKSTDGFGLNMWGPTIINQTGGALFSQIFTSWVQLFTCGPKCLRLKGPFDWQWPYQESEHIMNEDQLETLGQYTQLEIDRDRLIQQLTTLAQFGKQAATGDFFILHLGI